MPLLLDVFSSALPYDQYLATGTEDQRRRWMQVYNIAQLDAPRQQLVAGFQREIKILIHSGIWCGDCVEQCPLIQRIAEANSAKIDLRFVERQMNSELSEELRITTEEAGFPSFNSSLKMDTGVPRQAIGPSIAIVLSR